MKMIPVHGGYVAASAIAAVIKVAEGARVVLTNGDEYETWWTPKEIAAIANIIVAPAGYAILWAQEGRVEESPIIGWSLCGAGDPASAVPVPLAEIERGEDDGFLDCEAIRRPDGSVQSRVDHTVYSTTADWVAAYKERIKKAA